MFKKYVLAGAIAVLGGQLQAGVLPSPVLEKGEGDVFFVQGTGFASLGTDFEFLNTDQTTGLPGDVSTVFDITWTTAPMGPSSFDSASYTAEDFNTFELDDASLDMFQIISANAFSAKLTFFQNERGVASDGDLFTVSSDDFAFDLTGDLGEAGILSFFADSAMVQTLFSAEYFIHAAPTPVPLPAGAVLMMTGLAGLGALRARKRAA